jgi:hypothetical protein
LRQKSRRSWALPFLLLERAMTRLPSQGTRSLDFLLMPAPISDPSLLAYAGATLAAARCKGLFHRLNV